MMQGELVELLLVSLVKQLFHERVQMLSCLYDVVVVQVLHVDDIRVSVKHVTTYSLAEHTRRKVLRRV